MPLRARRLLATILCIVVLGGCMDQPPVTPGTPPTPPAAGLLRRGPYLQDVTGATATVVWQTDPATTGTLVITPAGSSGTPTRVQDPSATSEHALQAGGLQPGTSYAYTVRAGDQTAGGGTFRTAPAPGTAGAFTFLVWGDSGCGCPEQTAVAAQMLGSPADLLLHTGDLIYEQGEAALFDARFFAPYHDLLARAPVYPVLGNHDVGTSNGAPWQHAFWLPGDGGAHTTRYYAFDYGNAHFIALDSEEDFGPTSAQYNWLLADLAGPRAQAATWRFAFFHRPPYSSGLGHGSSYDLREAWSPLFERYGVDVVFTGHEHNYERTLPLRDYTATGGTHPVVYIVSGGGGKQAYDVGHKAWTAFSAMRYHYVSVRIEGGHLHLDAIDSTGAHFDSLDLSH